MWSSSFSLGSFVGATVSGFLVEHFGFKATTAGFFVLYCLNTLADVVELAYQIKISKNN